MSTVEATVWRCPECDFSPWWACKHCGGSGVVGDRAGVRWVWGAKPCNGLYAHMGLTGVPVDAWEKRAKAGALKVFRDPAGARKHQIERGGEVGIVFLDGAGCALPLNRSSNAAPVGVSTTGGANAEGA